MRIGLLTIHNSFSHGGRLQAYALQSSLEPYGEVEIIDYDLPHRRRSRRPVRLGFNPRTFPGAGKDVLRLRRRLETRRQFRLFQDAFLRVGNTIPAGELPEYAQSLDAVVVGSDQVWNPNIVNPRGRFDPNYYLGFVPGNIPKIAYAPSAGDYKYSGTHLKLLAEHTHKFQHLSARERPLQKTLETITGKSVRHVPDPTLLISRKAWDEVADRGEKRALTTAGPYILLYGIKKTPLLLESARRICKELGMPCISVNNWIYSPRWISKTAVAGPHELLALIRDAQYVITDSFHGTLFSTKFNRPFSSVSPGPNVVRIVNYLEELKLESRVIYDKEEYTSFRDPIDFTAVVEGIDNIAVRGTNFLKASFNALSG